MSGDRQGAEQDLLLVRLGVDTGARRGELAALRIDDLDGRVLRIERAVSAGAIASPKAGSCRRVFLNVPVSWGGERRSPRVGPTAPRR